MTDLTARSRDNTDDVLSILQQKGYARFVLFLYTRRNYWVCGWMPVSLCVPVCMGVCCVYPCVHVGLYVSTL